MFVKKLIQPVLFTDSATAIDIGYLPANAIISKIRVLVGTAFNAGTTNVIDIGTAADPNKYVAANDITAAGVATITQLLAGQLESETEPTLIEATYSQTGTAATTGACYVIIEYAQL